MAITTGTMNSWASFRLNSTARTVSVVRQMPRARTDGMTRSVASIRPASCAVTFSAGGSAAAGPGSSVRGGTSASVALSIMPLAFDF
ncbi:hypothetical protein D3C85_1262630 [compost metagenome]